MTEQNEQILKPSSKWLNIIITQIVCVSIILLALLIMKYFFKPTFNSVKEWYEINICNDTDINEVLLSDGDNDEI